MNTAMMDGVVPDQFFLDMALDHLKYVDAVLLVGTWIGSSGSADEYSRAAQLQLKIFHSDDDIPNLRNK